MTTQPKRDQIATCPVCCKSFAQDGIGRMRHYCSDACRVKANRQKHSTRRKELNTVRTDYLEQQIGYYESMYDHGAADALRRLAREVSAPIDAERIKAARAMYDGERERWIDKA